jgi:hypothetical protein
MQAYFNLSNLGVEVRPGANEKAAVGPPLFEPIDKFTCNSNNGRVSKSQEKNCCKLRAEPGEIQ